MVSTTLLFLSLSLAVWALPPTITPGKVLSFSHSSNVSNPNLGVVICTGEEHQGTCEHSLQPENKCINLKTFAGNTLTFNPDLDIECFLMQGHCDADKDYLDLVHDGPRACNLSSVPWRADMASYTCWNSTLF